MVDEAERFAEIRNKLRTKGSNPTTAEHPALLPTLDWKYLVEDELLFTILQCRVFIMGVEVSDWVAQINTTVTSNEPNSCEITLSNPNNIWILTEANLVEDRWNVVDDPQSNEIPKNKLFIYKSQKQMIDKQGDLEFKRWPMYKNMPIFHSGDTVRAFIRVPWSGDEDQWLPFFCGYVVNVSAERDLLTNSSTIQLSCQDIKWLLGKSRVVQNKLSEAYEEKALTGEPIIDSAGLLFSDMGAINQVYSQSQTGLNAQAIISTMFYGVADPSQKEIPKLAVGNMTTALFVQGEYEKDYYMDKWFERTLFGIDTCNQSRTPLISFNDVTDIGSKSDFYGEYAPHGNKIGVAVLLPPKGYGFQTLTDYQVDANAQEVEFASRLDILQSFLEPIDLNMVVNGFGDIFFEFPRYDFTLDLWGDYAKFFALEGVGTNLQINDNSAEAPNVIVVTGGVEGVNFAVEGSDIQKPTKAVLVNRPFIMRHGINNTTINFPYALDCSRLITLAAIRLMKELSRATTFNLNGFFFLPQFLPNNLVYFAEGDCYALIDSVTHSLSFGEDATGSTDLNLSTFRFRLPPAKTLSSQEKEKRLQAIAILQAGSDELTTSGTLDGLSYPPETVTALVDNFNASIKDFEDELYGKFVFITGTESGIVPYNTLFPGAATIEANVGQPCEVFKAGTIKQGNFDRQAKQPVTLQDRQIPLIVSGPAFAASVPADSDTADGAQAAVTNSKDANPTPPSDAASTIPAKKEVNTKPVEEPKKPSCEELKQQLDAIQKQIDDKIAAAKTATGYNDKMTATNKRKGEISKALYNPDPGTPPLTDAQRRSLILEDESLDNEFSNVAASTAKQADTSAETAQKNQIQQQMKSQGCS